MKLKIMPKDDFESVDVIIIVLHAMGKREL